MVSSPRNSVLTFPAFFQPAELADTGPHNNNNTTIYNTICDPPLLVYFFCFFIYSTPSKVCGAYHLGFPYCSRTIAPQVVCRHYRSVACALVMPAGGSGGHILASIVTAVYNTCYSAHGSVSNRPLRHVSCVTSTTLRCHCARCNASSCSQWPCVYLLFLRLLTSNFLFCYCCFCFCFCFVCHHHTPLVRPLERLWPSKQEQYKRERLDLLFKHVQRIDPDIICLQEVTVMWWSAYYRRYGVLCMCVTCVCVCVCAAQCPPPPHTHLPRVASNPMYVLTEAPTPYAVPNPLYIAFTSLCYLKIHREEPRGHRLHA